MWFTSHQSYNLIIPSNFSWKYPIGNLEFFQSIISSDKWNIIIYTAKARPDRPLVNGKNGVELVWEWLEKYDVAKYIDEVTHEKPRAEYYIDDKGIKFEGNWKEILEEVLWKRVNLLQ